MVVVVFSQLMEVIAYQLMTLAAPTRMELWNDMESVLDYPAAMKSLSYTRFKYVYLACLCCILCTLTCVGSFR